MLVLPFDQTPKARAVLLALPPQNVITFSQKAAQNGNIVLFRYVADDGARGASQQGDWLLLIILVLVLFVIT